MEEDAVSLAAERSSQTADLLQRLTAELQQFDVDTQAHGLNVLEVVQATQVDLANNTQQQQQHYTDVSSAGDSASDSVHASLLSLTTHSQWV